MLTTDHVAATCWPLRATHCLLPTTSYLLPCSRYLIAYSLVLVYYLLLLVSSDCDPHTICNLVRNTYFRLVVVISVVYVCGFCVHILMCVFLLFCITHSNSDSPSKPSLQKLYTCFAMCPHLLYIRPMPISNSCSGVVGGGWGWLPAWTRWLWQNQEMKIAFLEYFFGGC